MTAPFTLARELREGKTVFMGWVGTPDPLVAETVARSRFGAVTLDMQHGWHGPQSIADGVRAVILAGKAILVRVPVGDFAFASRALDMGVEAVIAPMVNTADDARAFVDAVKYPPVGKRSWGPGRATNLTGLAHKDYLAWTRENVLSFAMIETRQAIDNLEVILDVPGIDGVFVGPSDLSLTLSDGAVIDPLSPDIHEAVAHILAAAKARGKLAAVFAANSLQAKAFAAQGYQLIAIGTDNLYLTRGCNDIVDAASA